MTPDELLGRILSSRFVSKSLCEKRLGFGKDTISAAKRYLQLPIPLRPVISDFFDRQFYIEKYPDVLGAGLDPFIEFMTTGCSHGRSPHPLVDLGYIRSLDPSLLPDGCGPNDLLQILDNNTISSSPYFFLDHYRNQVPNVTGSLLAHFLTEGMPLGLRPNPLYDCLWYSRQLGDGHDVSSGLRHFVLQGDLEGCAPSPEFSGRRYLDRNPDVAEAGVPALAHYLTNGRAEKRPYHPVKIEVFTSSDHIEAHIAVDKTSSVLAYQHAKSRIHEIHHEQKDNLVLRDTNILRFRDPANEIAKLKLPKRRNPKLSIIIPMYNETAYTIECIASIIRSSPKVSYELIVADDASTDILAPQIRHIRNIKIVAQPSNVGFLINCNAAFRSCVGSYVLLLNNDVQVTQGALDAMVEVLNANSDVAAVGPKFLYPDGRLQEAGCTLDRDGVSTMVGLFGDPARPEYNRCRDVHYCSGAALLVRRSDVGDILFDERFRPAYCEDADLCLRFLAKNLRVVYCSRAEVVHHLSVSTSKESSTKRLQLVSKNQQQLAEKWSSLLASINTARVIAFYLPQFYPTPENDFHWGRGFTEWSNVAKATPAYAQHYQPHIPADLGFYDLRVRETIEHQTLLARRYGIGGFCVYYYNFGQDRALEYAFEGIVADKTIDFPYCVCWANENWTRNWDGGDRSVIFEQHYDSVTLRGVIQDAIRYAADPRYLRVNGKPLFLVYRPLLIPDPQEFAALCRRGFHDAGLGDIHLVYVESMETAQHARCPASLGFDACIEFPPHGRAVAAESPRSLTRPQYLGTQYDYESTILADMKRPSVDYKRYPTVFPSLDNTPRNRLRGDSFINATPEIFQAYIEEKLEYMRTQFVGDDRLLFVNAWNEWAEGTHLEPDEKFGHRWLEAVHNALMEKSLL